MAIEDLREIGNVLYRVGADGMLYPVQRMRPDQPAARNAPSNPGLLDFLNGTGIAERAGLANQMLNPLEAIGGSMRASERMLAPDTEGWDRVQALGDMLSGVAGVAAPAAVAGRAGVPAATALVEGLLGGSPAMQTASDTARSAGRTIAERANLPGRVPTMYSNPVPGLLGDGGSKIDEATGLPLNPDGTITLYHGTTKDAAQSIVKSGKLKSAGERDVYLTTDKTAGGYGDGTVVAVKVNPKRVTLDDEFPGGRMDFRMPVGGKLTSQQLDISMAGSDVPVLPAPRNEAEAIAKNILEQRATGDVSGVTEDMRAAADPQYMYANTPLPMDAASRLARADARGAKSGYRADKDLFSFKTGQGKQTGIGVTMSNDPAVANSYIDKGDLVYPVYNLGKKGASIDASGSRWNDISPYSEMRLTSGREMQLSDAMPPEGNLEDYQLAELEHYLSTGNKLPDSDFGYSTDDVARYLKGRGADYTSFENIVDPGAYGRFKTPEANLPATTTMVADPANVRSRFALFDPMFSHLRNLSAGVAISPLAYGLLSDPTDRGRNQ